jgi:ELKS/RAB6-interacting/CAST family member 2
MLIVQASGFIFLGNVKGLDMVVGFCLFCLFVCNEGKKFNNIECRSTNEQLSIDVIDRERAYQGVSDQLVQLVEESLRKDELIKSLTDDKDELAKEMEELEVAALDLKQKLETMTSQKTTLEATLENDAKECESLKILCRDKESTIEELKSDVGRKDSALAELNEAVSRKDSLLEELKKSVDDKDAIIDDLKASASVGVEVETAKLRAELADATGEIDKLQQEVTNAETARCKKNYH